MLSTRLLSRHFRREAISCLPQLLAQQHRPISIQNCNPAETPDVLFHLGLSSDSNLAEEFGDVKFFCTGGSAKRMRLFAEKVAVSGSISRRRVVGWVVVTVCVYVWFGSRRMLRRTVSQDTSLGYRSGQLRRQSEAPIATRFTRCARGGVASGVGQEARQR